MAANATYSERLARFVELQVRKDELEEELKTVQKEINELGSEEGRLVEDFIELGQSSVKTPKGTVSLASTLWAGALGADRNNPGQGDYKTTCNALIAAGLGDMVKETFNVQTLSAWLREQPLDENMDPILPPELVGKMKVSRRIELKFRKAPARH